MTDPRADPLMMEAIKTGAAAITRVSAVMISEHEAMRLATAALTSAEPLMRRHMMLDLSDGVQQALGNVPGAAELAVALRAAATS